MELKKVSAIIQARMSSTRLPGKVLREIRGTPLIEIIIRRLKTSKYIDRIIVATSENDADFEVINWCKNNNVLFFRGSEENVLKRFYNCCIDNDIKNILRITSDCPLIDPLLVDQAIKTYSEKNVDYLSNTLIPTFPDGLDLEIFSFDTLEKTFKRTSSQLDCEHVTPYMRNSKDFKLFNVKNEINLSRYRLTVDVKEDLDVISELIKKSDDGFFISFKEISNLIYTNHEIFEKNLHIKRNEGLNMNKGMKLYSRAKKIIPGGNMLLSKRPEMFLPGKWPSYYKKAKGCEIWGIDDQRYTDMSIMGIGTNILGYANEEVDEAVIASIRNSNMSSLNCTEEVFLSEELLKIHPWAEMVKLARSGGEALAIAVRIARSYSGRDEVAICGYHGWHDWYLSANLQNKENLNNHLINGLTPKGVPEKLRDLTHPFEYNNIDTLRKIISERNIGVIVMEVSRSEIPTNNFLEEVKSLSDKHGIVLIFDECTSGFRETFGGIHKKFNINPDICMLGKALGNGYPITALIGKKEVMQEAQSSFISSTFWTERSGPVAALKTLEVMKRTESWEVITNKGHQIRKNLKLAAELSGIKIEIKGLIPLINFSLPYKNWLKYKTFITQEMLKKNILASNLIYVSTAHSDTIIKEYSELIKPIFEQIQKFEDGLDIDNFLESDVCHSGLQKIK